ncbi:sugar MFS transporter [Saccharicrinis sp. FJH2]|uniref:sugar MFS transporter n=1 Tax=unclassified Saccharicrinis TaxID=2646859 RepID=UPI0035D44D27
MQTTTRSKFPPIIIIGALFFIFGFVTWLNSILIPYLQISCELTNFEAMFVAFMFYISYFFMALPSAWILKRTGYKNGMMIGLFVMSFGTILFVPAALSRTYSVFLSGLFIMGTGLALLQTAANPYVTILGPIESAAKRISIMGICNKLAGAIAPLILAYYILNDVDTLTNSLELMGADERIITLNALARRVIGPYIVMTIALIAMGIGVKLSPLPQIEPDKNETVSAKKDSHKTVFSYPNLILGVIALFFYVGVEVIAGDTIVRHGNAMGISMNLAKTFTSATMVFMTIGYIIGIITVPKYISQQGILKISAISGILFSLAAILLKGEISVVFIALLGLSNAMVWPAIWPLALNGLGKHTNTGSAMLIMAILGGALLPLLWGKLFDLYNSQVAYWILVPSYLFILYYAIKGYKIRG